MPNRDGDRFRSRLRCTTGALVYGDPVSASFSWMLDVRGVVDRRHMVVVGRPSSGRWMSIRWTLDVLEVDAPASINPRENLLPVRAEAGQAEGMQDRIALRSKLLAAAVAERDKPRFRHMSRKEWDEIFDPCRSREPVYAWLLANHAKVIKARQHRNGWNGL